MNLEVTPLGYKKGRVIQIDPSRYMTKVLGVLEYKIPITYYLYKIYK